MQITEALHASENYPGLRWDIHISLSIYVYIDIYIFFSTTEFSIILSTDLIQNESTFSWYNLFPEHSPSAISILIWDIFKVSSLK